jgi:hypothetical protein
MNPSGHGNEPLGPTKGVGMLCIVLHLMRPLQKEYIIHDVIKILHKFLSTMLTLTIRDARNLLLWKTWDKNKETVEECAWMLCL